MNGKMVVSKPLYVALAQRKEDRRAKLQVFLLSILYYCNHRIHSRKKSLGDIYGMFG
jgi:hypothetical protein